MTESMKAAQVSLDHYLDFKSKVVKTGKPEAPWRVTAHSTAETYNVDARL